MTPCHATASCSDRTVPSRWDHLDIADVFLHFDSPHSSSQRQYAADHGIPRSTLGYWLRHDAPEGIDPHVAAFFRCPAGIAFCRRLVLALFLVFHFRSASGLRSLCLFLELSQLDRFVAASYTALRNLAVRIEEDLLAFEQEQRPRLAKEMLPKSIAVCLDENFHRDKPYLVGIEPLSNFLLLETHSPTRDGEIWTQEVKQATADLNVKIALLCSDRAKGLLACAEHGLGVPHSPDLMHMQREILQPMLLPLRRQVDHAQAEVEKQQTLVEAWQTKKEAYEDGPRSAGRPPQFDEHISQAKKMQQQAQLQQQRCEQRCEEASKAIRELADQAHPFDAKMGARLDAKEVCERLDQSLGRLEKIVEEADLSEKADLGVAKGFGWATTLMGLVTWFWELVRQRVEKMNLSEDTERAVYEELLPGLYWRQQVRRGRDAEQKRQRKELSAKLLMQAWRQGGALSRLSEEEKAELLRQGEELAGLFVRSSSCVEGRNGRLSLLQHGHVRLSKQRLKVQTVIHNYMLRREDGTTAAERFFGKKPADLFESLLSRMSNLPRPAAKRPRKESAETANAG